MRMATGETKDAEFVALVFTTFLQSREGEPRGFRGFSQSGHHQGCSWVGMKCYFVPSLGII